MKWPRRNKDSVDLVKKGPTTESKHAVQDSGDRLEATRAEWPEINRRAKSLRERRERNHFAEMIRRTVLGEERDDPGTSPQRLG